MQKYTFFFKKQALSFTVEPSFGKISCSEKDVLQGEKINFPVLFEKLLSKNIDIICGKDKDFLLEQFMNYFKLVEAAGGLVQNEKGAYLFIFRRGKWDFPKGKIDEGENPEQAALREVHEECGLSDLGLKDFFAETFHIYFENEMPILKKTYWFNMISTSSQELIPQAEEQITDVCWLSKQHFREVKKNTYKNIELLLEKIP